MEDTRVNLVLADARNFVLASPGGGVTRYATRRPQPDLGKEQWGAALLKLAAGFECLVDIP